MVPEGVAGDVGDVAECNADVRALAHADLLSHRDEGRVGDEHGPAVRGVDGREPLGPNDVIECRKDRLCGGRRSTFGNTCFADVGEA